MTGTQVTGTFAFGAATTLPPGLTVPPNLLIQGNFTITLSCCASGDGRTCSGSPAPQTITGTFAAGFVEAVLAVALNVTSTDGADPVYTVTAQQMSLTAGQVKFAFQATGLAGPKLNGILRDAFNAGAVTQALQAINAHLAAPVTLSALGGLLSPAFTSLANPPLVAFALSMLYNQAVKPTGPYYLPKDIKEANNPVLEPFAAGGWDITDSGQWFSTAGATICASIGGTVNQDEIQTPNTAVPLSLSSITVAGTSNMFALPPLTVGNSIHALIACNGVNGWPVQLSLAGGFTLTVSCCVTEDDVTCSAPSQSNVGEGTFAAKIAHATVSATITVSTSPDGKNLIATADAIYFQCDPNVNDRKNIDISIAITSIPSGQQKVWNDMANQIFNSSLAATAIVDQIRAKLNQPVVRDRLSEIATKAIQSVLGPEPDLHRRVLHEVAATTRRRGA